MCLSKTGVGLGQLRKWHPGAPLDEKFLHLESTISVSHSCFMLNYYLEYLSGEHNG